MLQAHEVGKCLKSRSTTSAAALSKSNSASKNWIFGDDINFSLPGKARHGIHFFVTTSSLGGLFSEFMRPARLVKDD
jgi:hypothetical protein